MLPYSAHLLQAESTYEERNIENMEAKLYKTVRSEWCAETNRQNPDWNLERPARRETGFETTWSNIYNININCKNNV